MFLIVHSFIVVVLIKLKIRNEIGDKVTFKNFNTKFERKII